MAATQYFTNPKTFDEVMSNVYAPVSNSIQYRAFSIPAKIANPRNRDEIAVNIYDPITNTIM